MNTKVANDKKIVSALVAMLSNKNKDIARGACNAVMDLATTSIGREKLRDCRAIDQLLSLHTMAKQRMLMEIICREQVAWIVALRWRTMNI